MPGLNFGEWKVHLNRPLDRLGGDIIIFRYTKQGHDILRFGESGQMIIESIAAGHDNTFAAPTMRLEYEEDVRGILAAFVALAGEQGIKAPTGEYATGKLEATTEHLADMRKLVFKDEVK